MLMIALILALKLALLLKLLVVTVRQRWTSWTPEMEVGTRDGWRCGRGRVGVGLRYRTRYELGVVVLPLSPTNCVCDVYLVLLIGCCLFCVCSAGVLRGG